MTFAWLANRAAAFRNVRARSRDLQWTSRLTTLSCVSHP
jgi:hypothetical protein